MRVEDPTQQAASTKPYGSAAYSWYVVTILALVYACHAMDRGMPTILVEPIRHEFGLSDSELGLFTGLGFGVAFAVAVLPMGYLSDRVNRRNFLAVILLLWSICTALGGVVRSYGQLVLTRVGVGAAESGAAPVTLPMISDIFPQSKRAFAMGIFYMGPPLGGFLASTVGGYVAAEHGWRTAFFIAGVPGIILALLMLTTVREPKRGGSEVVPIDEHAPRLREVFGFLMHTPALLCLILGAAMIALVSITFGAWTGSFFIRIHGLDLKQVGLIMGLGGGLCSLVGPPISGWVSDRLAQRGPAWPLYVVVITSVIGAAGGMAMLFGPLLWLSVAGYVIADLTRSMFPPALFSVLMDETPPRMRGTVMSSLQLTTNLIGFGLGPVFVGFLSDLYGGETALRYALANALLVYVAVVVLILAGAHMLFGRKAPTA